VLEIPSIWNEEHLLRCCCSLSDCERSELSLGEERLGPPRQTDKKILHANVVSEFLSCRIFLAHPRLFLI
jgi:hypothetical protein